MAPRHANISNTSSRASSDVESHESLLTLAESRSGASQSINNVKPQATKCRPAAGYEVCAHTCVKGGCYSPATKTLLWNKDGASARQHGTNPNLHMDCNEDCPAADMLAWNVRAGMAYPHRLGAVRPPTNEEMEAALLLDDSSKILDGMATFKNDVEVGAEFHLLFVPDPTTGASREIEAKADVGFATTTLSKEQFQKVEHLKHHIYPLKKVKEGVKALIQEWVSGPCVIIFVLYLNHFHSYIYVLRWMNGGTKKTHPKDFIFTLWTGRSIVGLCCIIQLKRKWLKTGSSSKR